MLNMPSLGEFGGGRGRVGVAAAGVQMLSYLGERYAAAYLNSAAAALANAGGATFVHQIKELGASAAAAGTKDELSRRSVKVRLRDAGDGSTAALT